MQYELHHGDCLDVLRAMPDNSVDSIVTDPPYGLSDHKPADVVACLAAWLAGKPYLTGRRGFMGKTWDSWVPGPEVWRECLRVLKPGGHVLAFASSRTHDLMSMAMRLAGFECRDTVMYLYGSGFPKSADVSKAIDKMDAAEEQERRRLAFTAWVRSQGITSRQIDEATGTNMGGHYTTAASQPAIMTREHLEACRNLFREVPQWVEREADIRSLESRNMAARELLSERPAYGIGGNGCFNGHSEGATARVTLPATEAARQWQGWGTSLKPAFEPALMFRKPLIGTVAENVLAHGTGALNIDGCRVGNPFVSSGGAAGFSTDKGWNQNSMGVHEPKEVPGRWPANLLHDGSEEVLSGFPVTGASKSGVRDPHGSMGYHGGASGLPGVVSGHDDQGGSAARFFKQASHDEEDVSYARFMYCAKASKKDRGEGNGHPTVKPTDLMAYLCRLVTPPGGTVLDPFMGSGSTGKAALREGFRFIGIEREAEYLAIAEARIKAECEKQAKQPSVEQLDLLDAA